MYEDLFYPGERKFGTTNRKVKRTQSEIIAWPSLAAHLEDLLSLANSGTEMSIRAKVKEIIPDYSYEVEPVRVPQETVEEVPAPIMGVSSAFAAGAGQD